MKILNQKDPKWASLKLGSKGLLTIGGYGCTTTGLAEINNLFGANCTPSDVAAHIDWYTPEGLVLWAKLDLKYAAFDPMGRVYNFDLNRIVESLTTYGKACLLQVKIPGFDKHWLKGEAVGYDGKIYARDPLSGSIIDVVAKYGAITGSAHFSKKTS